MLSLVTLSCLPTSASATTCATTAACVFGTNTASGPGVLGTSAKADGIDGKTFLNGTSSHAASGIAGFDLSSSIYNSGVFGNSLHGQGVHGSSQNGSGVFGGAATGTGVHGTSSIGVGVRGESKSNSGVFGSSVTGYGVYGSSTSNFGISGNSTDWYGVEGFSVNLPGVIAETTHGDEALIALSSGFGDGILALAQGGGIAMHAVAQSAGAEGANISSTLGPGAFIGGATIGAEIAGNNTGIVGRSSAGRGSQPLLLTDLSDNTLFYVDGNGDVYYHGIIHKFAATRGDAMVDTYSSATTTPSIEDVGNAELVNGQAIVKLDVAFAQSIDLQTQYHVFLTPNGDTRGLYIAAKSADRFIVRETQGGHGTLAFDYKVVAAMLGHRADRMVLVSKAAVAAATPHIQSRKARFVLPKLPSRVHPVALNG